MIGSVFSQAGMLTKQENFMVVKKVLAVGDQIAKHNHEGHHIVFTVVSGRITVLLDEQERHQLQAGEVMVFSGSHHIQSEVLKEAATVVITLIANQ